jgi:hypothetical protein
MMDIQRFSDIKSGLLNRGFRMDAATLMVTSSDDDFKSTCCTFLKPGFKWGNGEQVQVCVMVHEMVDEGKPVRRAYVTLRENGNLVDMERANLNECFFNTFSKLCDKLQIKP